MSKIGKVERTTVANDAKYLHHVPDFVLHPFSADIRVNIEIEYTKKTQKRYTEILLATKKDGVNKILYIFPKHSDIVRYANYMPIDQRLQFIDIDTLISNIKNYQKIKAISQDEIRLSA